ncbi:hypothetical protein BB427_10900 [Pseudoalteromonas sp. BMB]|uniref:hypothetical protein n=1 Tax=Pseudoalteromonas sp. BMB TaxID=1874619 RepID=UPI00083D5D32|nr:hypothetical protein [Pseudoalteromonas sp. BMB]ODB42013.1 hypothetical protein BB427_10900 [Pseudoalteromonas sp. BMB]
MSRREGILRIVLTMVFVVAGLLCLNQSVYSFWIAGGPPTDFPNVWYQNGIIWGWRGLALLVFGIFFRFKWRSLRSSWLAKLITAIVIFGMLYPYIREQLLIDSCLDGGGAWSTQHFDCKK